MMHIIEIDLDKKLGYIWHRSRILYNVGEFQFLLWFSLHLSYCQYHDVYTRIKLGEETRLYLASFTDSLLRWGVTILTMIFFTPKIVTCALEFNFFLIKKNGCIHKKRGTVASINSQKTWWLAGNKNMLDDYGRILVSNINLLNISKNLSQVQFNNHSN